MTKDRKTFTLDERNSEYLDNPQFNASGLVNELIRMHRESDGEDAVLGWKIEEAKREIEDVERQIESLKEKRESLEDHLATLEAARQRKEDKKSETLDEAVEALEGVPRDPDNKAIKHWARNMEMKPVELLDELEERDDDD